MCAVSKRNISFLCAGCTAYLRHLYMAIIHLDVDTFVKMAAECPVADVRSPGEYAHAHIPAAVSFPLFSDEERRIVGTAYKQQSREDAIKIGLDFFGPKMRPMVEEAERLLQNSADKRILVHCWRGGMRSGAVAWLLDLYGFEVYLLKGGYKAFRNWALELFKQPRPFAVLGGYTGSGKTLLLAALEEAGESVIDLEKLAGHKGSAFGNLGLPPQPGAEQVENNLALALLKTEQQRIEKGNRHIWLEDESRRIGNINLPEAFFSQLRAVPFVFLDIPFEVRLENVLKDYGRFSAEELSNPVNRIRRRLGDEYTRNALRFLEEGDTAGCFRILLRYYDKFYRNSSLSGERKVHYTEWDGRDIPGLIAQLKKYTG